MPGCNGPATRQSSGPGWPSVSRASPQTAPTPASVSPDADTPGGAEGLALTPDLAPRIAPLLERRIAGLGEHAPADLSFGNLWLFRHAHQWRWHGGAWPCVAGRAYDGQRLAVPLFDVREAPRGVLHDLALRHGGLFPLCRHEAEALGRSGWELSAERADADYLYPAGQFRGYRGPALHKKANLVAQLHASHTLHAEPYRPALQPHALAVLQGWLHDKGKAAGDADDAPCREALAGGPELRLEGFMHWADGQPAGFLLAEPLQPGVWVVRFAKGLVRFKGITQHMFRHFAERPDARVDWLNFEQDLGLAHFRQTKLSYRPALLLPKWRLLPGPPA
ncbi:hypothetical protein C8248_00365 [Paracidovorax avenae]|nr:hypothetical protein C8236_00370 [Paracidovorax avenae]AVT04603.1 hypothetical protein C8248_00365 [Paracidovorax avenae]